MYGLRFYGFLLCSYYRYTCMLYLYSNLLPIISPVSLFGRNTSLDYLDIADLSIYKTRLFPTLFSNLVRHCGCRCKFLYSCFNIFCLANLLRCLDCVLDFVYILVVLLDFGPEKKTILTFVLKILIWFGF